MVKELGTNEINETTLTKEIKDDIERLITTKNGIKMTQDQLNDDMEAIAKKIGIKKGVLLGRINCIIKEQGSGGEVLSKSKDIEFVEKYFNIE
ncbi:hypothetical protein GW796_06985 [archaeon]|nr:hypothetical protein [archaeon]